MEASCQIVASHTAALDYRLLVVTSALRQAHSCTACVAADGDRPRAVQGPVDALVAVFAGGDARLAPSLAGSFHPHVAQALRDGSASTSVKTRFTLGF